MRVCPRIAGHAGRHALAVAENIKADARRAVAVEFQPQQAVFLADRRKSRLVRRERLRIANVRRIANLDDIHRRRRGFSRFQNDDNLIFRAEFGGGEKAFRRDALPVQPDARDVVKPGLFVAARRQFQRDIDDFPFIIEPPQFDAVAFLESPVAQAFREKRAKANARLRRLAPEYDIQDHRKIARHRPKLPLRIDHRPKQIGAAFVRKFGQTGHKFGVFHVRQIHRREAHERFDGVIHRRVIAGASGGAQAIRRHKRPDRAVMVNRRVRLLRPNHGRARRTLRIIGDNRGRLRFVRNAKQHGERLAEQIEFLQRGLVELGGGDAAVQSAFLKPKLPIDGGF